jgi:hypothetical protein
MNINCKSTVNGMSDTVTQIIHFVGGVKRTYHGILSDSIKQGQMTKFKLSDGRLIFINDANVLCIEIIDESSQV